MSKEDDQRAANLVTCYGVGTRSYNRSAEKKEMDRQRAEATEHWQKSERQEIEVRPRGLKLPPNIAAWPPYWRELYEERAGIIEFQANLPRQRAEFLAENEIRRAALEATRRTVSQTEERI